MWGKRRKRIIDELNEAADYITTLHEVSRGVDIAGTSVSLLGASGAAVGAGAALFFSTAPVSIPAFGAITVVGGTVSAGSQLIRNGVTEERKNKLKKILEEDAKDIAVLGKLMETLDGALERLKNIETVLKYIFVFGQVGIKKLVADQLSVEETKKVLQTVDKIVNNDKFITYMATTVMTVTSAGINSMSDEIDWQLFIKFSAEIVTGLTTVAMGGRILEAVTEAHCTLSLVKMSSFVLAINVLTIGLDIYHLVKIGMESEQSKQPEIVNQIRETAKQLQKQLDKLPKKQIKID